MYASPWFLTLFASVLSLTMAFRVLDVLLVEGREIIFRVGLALLDSSQEQLLQMDMEDMIKVRRREDGEGGREVRREGGEGREGGMEGGGGEGRTEMTRPHCVSPSTSRKA